MSLSLNFNPYYSSDYFAIIVAAETNDGTSPSKDERGNTSELILSASSSSFDCTSNKHASAS